MRAHAAPVPGHDRPITLSARLPSFVGVGLLGFVTQVAVLHVLAVEAGIHYAIATALAVEAAILQNFAWHEVWTWRDRAARRGGRLARLARFNGLTALVSVLGNVLLMTLFVEFLRLPLVVANAMAALSLSVVNLVGADRWVFRSQNHAPAPDTKLPQPTVTVPPHPNPLPRPGGESTWQAALEHPGGARWLTLAASGAQGRNGIGFVPRSRPRWSNTDAGAPTHPARAATTARLNGAGLVPVVAVLLVGAAARVEAADLQPETVAAWERYVALTEHRIERELGDTRRFLAADFDARDAARGACDELGSGTISVVNVVTTGDNGGAIDVAAGMIHHWRGCVFVPGASVDELVAALKDPTGRRAHRQLDVLATRVLERSADGLRLYLKLQRKNIVSVAYNTEHDVRYRWHGAGRASSRSVATRIAEIEELGTPQERERRPGHDRGFMWRLNSYWRYQAVPGGVVVELESLTLSRDLPWGLGTIARPLINIVARESMERTLSAMRSRFAEGAGASQVAAGASQ